MHGAPAERSGSTVVSRSARVVAVSALMTLAAPGTGLGHDGFGDHLGSTPAGSSSSPGTRSRRTNRSWCRWPGRRGGRPSPTARATHRRTHDPSRDAHRRIPHRGQRMQAGAST